MKKRGLKEFYWYTDMCCQDRRILHECLKLLKSVHVDPYHIMQRYKVRFIIKVSAKHPLTPIFFSYLRDALFVNCGDDIQKRKEDLIKRGMDPEKTEQISTAYFVSRGRCRRKIVDVLASNLLFDYSIVGRFGRSS